MPTSFCVEHQFSISFLTLSKSRQLTCTYEVGVLSSSYSQQRERGASLHPLEVPLSHRASKPRDVREKLNQCPTWQLHCYPYTGVWICRVSVSVVNNQIFFIKHLTESGGITHSHNHNYAQESGLLERRPAGKDQLVVHTKREFLLERDRTGPQL